MNELIFKLCTMTGCTEKQATQFIKPLLQEQTYSGEWIIHPTRIDALNDLIDFISGDRE